MNTVEDDEPISLEQMNRKPELRVEHPTPLRRVVPRLASHLVRADREVAMVRTLPGQIELPAKIGDGEFDDRQHETMQPVPIPHHVRQDERERRRDEVPQVERDAPRKLVSLHSCLQRRSFRPRWITDSA
jgi:hypothetical protein